MALTIPAIQFIEELGNYESRLNSPDGPLCNSDDFDDVDNVPAQIVLIEDLGAEEAGMMDGDIITQINDFPIKNSKSVIDDWPEKFPDVRPGDYVDVKVNRYGEEMSFSVKTSPREENPSQPMLGFWNYENPTCYNYFMLTEGEEFSEDALRFVLGG